VSRFAHAIPTEAEARELLRWRREKSEYQGELYPDAIACLRRLLPVARQAALLANRAFTPTPAHPCASCGRFAFPQPTRCFWCRSGADHA